MLVECECGAKYRYDERKFQGESQRRIDCPKCSRTIVVNNPLFHKTQVHDDVLDRNLKRLETPTFTLSVLKGITGGKIITLEPGTTTTIGRMGADIEIDDPEASRIHAEIHHDGEKLTVKDLNSSNGTFAGGEKITEIVLNDDCELRIGQTRLAIHKVLLRFD